MDTMDQIKQLVESNAVIIFMKGTPQFPQCGFSSRSSEALKACGEEFAYINIFEEPEIYKNLPQFSDWPTFPQIYISGELIGGCDITMDLHQRGELQNMVKAATAKHAAN